MNEYYNLPENDYPQNKKRLKFRIKPFPDNKPHINLILFLLTVVSTLLMLGPWYSLSIMLFLSAHEMGHYLMCRKYGVRATLPFFIPFPYLNPFGTMGAFIQIKSPIPSKKALFDIGAAGPLAGFVITLPLIYFGMRLSTIIPAEKMGEGGFYLGESILFKYISYLSIGKVEEGLDVSLHPLAYAGWVGLFVTALNLIPIGQLDGGHIFFSLFGRISKKTNIIFLSGFGVLTLIYPGWILLFILLLVFGRRHPAPIDNFTPLDGNRRLLGYFIFIIFLISFTPVPFKF
ncbi:site-2 protease family protein [candidate division KSB1 bacterium]|nr:site-2 protease family protein [candidate division KSB1 bacterium]